MTESFESREEIACVNPSIPRLIHSEPDSYLDDLVALASQICETPIAVISMLEGDRIWFKSRVGIAMIIAPIDRSLCKQVLCQNELIVVPDTHLREELRGHPIFHGARPIRFYAGLPLRGSSGEVFGTFCVMDHQPREIAEEQRNALWRFARLAVERIEWLISPQPPDTGRTAPEHQGRIQPAGESSPNVQPHPCGSEREEVPAVGFAEDEPGPVADETGGPEGVAASEESGAALARAADLFRDLFEFSDDGLIIADGSGKILRVNHQTEAMFGWSRSELVGQAVEVLIPENLRALHVEQGREYMRDPAARPMGLRRSGVAALRRDGTVFEVTVSLAPLETEDGHCVVFGARKVWANSGTVREALRNQRLESLGTLAAGIAHDLNNTFSPVTMALDFLKQEFPDLAQEWVDLIDTSVTRGSEMVRQLLSFTKGDGQGRVAHSIAPLLNELRALVVKTFPKSIEVEFFHSEGMSPVLMDSTQIHQVLLNLAVNARDAMPDGGLLRMEAVEVLTNLDALGYVGVPKAGPHVRIRVQDTGCGIEPEVLGKVFDPFFTTKGREQGTGIGLSGTLGIVRDHDGFIRIESAPGKGTQIEVFLPVHSGRSIVSNVENAASRFRGGGELILIVDDEESIRRVLSKVVEDRNFRVVTASHGAEAVRMLRTMPELPAVIVSDIDMPGMNGLEYLIALRSLFPKIPLIVCTGMQETDTEELENEFGVASVLFKPVRIRDFVETLAAVVSGSVRSVEGGI